MPYKLKSKKIKVCGEALTVFEASNLMEIRRSLMIDAAAQKWQNLGNVDGMDAQAAQYIETLVFPSLIACTTGNVPTLDEFLNSVPARDADAWMTTAKELNPRWFPDLSEKSPEEQAVDLEKNE